MKYLFFVAVLFVLSCANSDELKSRNANDTTAFVTNDTIPPFRDSVSKKPVASYMVPVGDPRFDYKFGVNVYETPKTFRYILDMHFESLNVTDTLKIPNFGMWPIIQVKPGKDKMSCIIGFLDKKKEFREYKMLTAKNNKMKLIVLKRYGVGTYSDVQTQ